MLTADKDEKLYPSYIAGGNVWPLWKATWQFFSKVSLWLLYNPAYVLLGIAPREMETYVYINLYMNPHSTFIPIVQNWEQLKYLLTGKDLNSPWYV